MRIGSLVQRIGIFVAGVLAGIGLTFGGFLWVNRDTVVFTTKDTVVADGIVIPKGTELVHDTEWSEGFDTLKIYVAVAAPELEAHFTKRVDDRSFLVQPRWVRE